MPCISLAYCKAYGGVDKIRDVDSTTEETDSGIVMADRTFFGDSFEQDRSWDDSGTTISGI